MDKLTFKKIAELTLQKVGRPLTTKEIWSKAIELEVCEPSFSKGKTPDQTIGAYLYWSLRDNEGVFTKKNEKPVKFGLTKFANQKKASINYCIVGTAYSDGNTYNELIDRSMISVGFCWGRNMNDLYGKPEQEIIDTLIKEGSIKKEYTAIKKFLQLKPGDLIALKGKGWPSAGKPCLEILGYAIVVERNNEVYFHDPNGLGHGIHVEFIEKDIKIDKKRGGYGSSVHLLSDPETIHHIFGDYKSSESAVVRERN